MRAVDTLAAPGRVRIIAWFPLRNAPGYPETTRPAVSDLVRRALASITPEQIAATNRARVESAIAARMTPGRRTR